MLSSPQDLAACHGLPKEGLFQRQLLAASLDLCSLALRYAGESLEAAVYRAHEGSMRR